MSSPEESQSAEQLLGDDHEALDKLLKALLVALDEAEMPTVFERLDLFWARLAMHIRAENLHLFPAILNRLEESAAQRSQLPLPSETREAIARLRDDHDFFMHEIAAAVKVVRTLISSSHSEAQGRQMEDVRRSIAAVRKRLESHNEVEEKLVYSLPSKLLTPNEQLALVQGIQRELQNLPPRFSDAREGSKS